MLYFYCFCFLFYLFGYGKNVFICFDCLWIGSRCYMGKFGWWRRCVKGGDVEGKDLYLLVVNSLLGKMVCNIVLK